MQRAKSPTVFSSKTRYTTIILSVTPYLETNKSCIWKSWRPLCKSGFVNFFLIVSLYFMIFELVAPSNTLGFLHHFHLRRKEDTRKVCWVCHPWKISRPKKQVRTTTSSSSLFCVLKRQIKCNGLRDRTQQNKTAPSRVSSGISLYALILIALLWRKRTRLKSTKMLLTECTSWCDSCLSLCWLTCCSRNRRLQRNTVLRHAGTLCLEWCSDMWRSRSTLRLKSCGSPLPFSRHRIEHQS